MFQTEGRREGLGHTARNGANDTIGSTASKDREYICVTEALRSGWGSTGHVYPHTQGVARYWSIEKSRLECD